MSALAQHNYDYVSSVTCDPRRMYQFLQLARERWDTLDLSKILPYDDDRAITLAAACTEAKNYIGFGLTDNGEPVALVCGFHYEHPYAAGRIAVMSILVSSVHHRIPPSRILGLIERFDGWARGHGCRWVQAGPDVDTRVPGVERLMQRAGYDTVGLQMRKEL